MRPQPQWRGRQVPLGPPPVLFLSESPQQDLGGEEGAAGSERGAGPGEQKTASEVALLGPASLPPRALQRKNPLKVNWGSKATPGGVDLATRAPCPGSGPSLRRLWLPSQLLLPSHPKELALALAVRPPCPPSSSHTLLWPSSYSAYERPLPGRPPPGAPQLFPGALRRERTAPGRGSDPQSHMGPRHLSALLKALWLPQASAAHRFCASELTHL